MVVVHRPLWPLVQDLDDPVQDALLEADVALGDIFFFGGGEKKGKHIVFALMKKEAIRNSYDRSPPLLLRAHPLQSVL